MLSLNSETITSKHSRSLESRKILVEIIDTNEEIA